MDLKHQYYLTNDFNSKIIKEFENISNSNFTKKSVDYIFNLIFPAINNFLSYKKVTNPDIISDFILQVYENFNEFLVKAYSFYQKNRENFIFYFYFLKFLYFNWQNFSRLRKTKKNAVKSEEFEYIDKIKVNKYFIASNDEIDVKQIVEVIKKCLNNHFEIEEKVMFLIYYYFLIDNEDYIMIADYFNIPIIDLLDLLDKNFDEDSIESFNKTIDEEVVQKLFNKDLNYIRVNVSRIKKKMKTKCNYLLENYLYIDEGDI